jgi:predicted metal-dependent hydrolase
MLKRGKADYNPYYPNQGLNVNFKRVMRYMLYIVIITLFLKYLVYEPYYSDTYDKYYDPKLEEIRERLAVVIPEIKHVDLSGSNKSFTINKKHVYICAKDESGQYYDDNMLTYVILHELAHVLCDEVGHTEKYKQIFRSLLERAHKAGLYDPSKPPIDNYCNY